MERPNPRDKATASFRLDLERGRHLEVSLARTPLGSFVHAEEHGVDGRVVGVINASQQALQRTLGLVQRLHQPENLDRDRPALLTTAFNPPPPEPTP